MSIRGIDVSDYQPNVDWKAVVNSDISFAFIKATEGAGFVAEVFPSYWEQTKANGLIRGAYHFFRPASDVKGQIDNFLKTVSLEPGDLPPVLDIETTDQLDAATVCDRAQEWLDGIEERTGFRPIVYTYPGFWQKLATDRFSDYPLWIAHYTQAEKPLVPGKWTTWVFWQYTDRGTVDGIDGGVDINLFENVLKGADGPKVKTVQKLLKNRGFDPGTIDGIFGPGTEGALIEFQKAKAIASDGIADLKTWTALMGQAENFVPPEGAEPEPEPTPEPEPEPEPTPTIELLDVCRIYHGSPTEDKALEWLQGQIGEENLLEFARRWRNEASPQTRPIRMLDVCRYYRELPSQNEALRWLQRQIPVTTLLEFERKWNATPEVEVDIKLLDVCKYYSGLSTQKEAIEWLQSQIPPATIAEFAKLWRRPSPRQ